MSATDRNEIFVRDLTGAQALLYGYILTLLPRRDAAADVLQETNLVLWRKSSEFEPGTNFTAWACSIARYQVLAYLSNKGRDRHRFDDELLATLARRIDARLENLTERQDALRTCLEKLPSRDRELVIARYTKGSSVKAIAERIQKTENAISRSLYRIRGLLLDCVQRQSLGREGA
jgi:RNA polymerase sigma-70 factor (ECF subfamily)